MSLQHYVITCSCGNPARSGMWIPSIPDVGHVIALVDENLVVPNYFNGNTPRGGFGYAQRANRFGEHRDPLTLGCPGGCTPNHSPIGASTAAHAVRFVARQAQKNGVQLPEVDVIDYERPATAIDVERFQAQVEADLFGCSHGAPQPKMVPIVTRRTVVDWPVFKVAVSRLPKQRPRAR